MRVIALVGGHIALHGSVDETWPDRGVLQRDLVEFVGNAYSFSVRPPIGSGIPIQANTELFFEQGKLVRGGDEYPITRLYIGVRLDIVSAHSTEIADVIANDYMERLDSGLGYHFKNADLKRAYLSNIVVQFDGRIEEGFGKIKDIEGLLTREIPRSGLSFKTKRLAFGHGDVSIVPANISVEAITNADFLIERRVGEPYEKNRYFCSAPLPLSQHKRVLEAVESILLA